MAAAAPGGAEAFSGTAASPPDVSDLAGEVVGFVASQLAVDSSELGLYELSGRTIEFHRGQIRAHLRFRVATINDQEKLTGWLVRTSPMPSVGPIGCGRNFSRSSGPNGLSLYYRAAAADGAVGHTHGRNEAGDV